MKNYWVFGLYPLSGILKSKEHNISETGSVSILRCRGTPTLLDPLERANFSHWTFRIYMLTKFNYEIFIRDG
jgi:hypothetical protein